jgi:phosphate transport system ATP-binding protein
LEEEKLNIVSLPVEDDKELIPEMEAAEAEQAGKEYEVETKNLSVSFNGRPAITDINLSVRKQTATAIIGPSGCGKSTFLRALNFMHDMIPKSKVTGEIIINKHSISEYDTVDLRKKVGMVFQKPNPFPKMSIYENVVSGLKLNGNKDKKDLNEVAENCLKHAGLWEEVKDRLKEPAVSLSGGQQQRLCIARTIAVSPEIILMDEPTSALDPISTQKIEELIFNLKKEFTILVVTHNMQQAARVSDHTAFFYMGKLIEYSRTRRMFTNPKEKLTEEYITGKFG